MATRASVGKAASKTKARGSSAKPAKAQAASAKPAKARGSSAKPAKAQAASAKPAKAGKAPTASAKKPKLLAGGNPQIAKADGDAPVQAYLAALTGWKREVGAWLDALIVRAIPKVTKAVKWNSPMYGLEGRGWIVSVHVFTKYVKVAFFRGASLRPVPPGDSTSKDARYLDIYEDDARDAKQMTAWLKQAAALPGWGKI